MKFTPGPAIASASGSLGGTTFSHNRFGAYTRKRAIPTDPNTDRQQQVKSNFGGLSTLWNTELTQAQRDTWISYGEAVPRIDALGQTHYLPGLQWFVGCNSLRIQAGLEILTEGPSVFNRTEVPMLLTMTRFDQQPSVPEAGTYLNLNDGAPLLNLQFTRSIAAGTRLFVFFGRPVNKTIKFYKAPWRYYTTVEGLAAPQVTINSTQSTPFPFAYTEGQSLFVRLRTMADDGRYSPPAEYRIPVWDVFE